MGQTTHFLRENPFGHTDFLVGKAKSGSQTAWREIFRRYRTMLVTHIQALVPGFARRRFDAEDVLQAAFARAWQSIQGFEYRGEGSFRRWLAKLVVNEFRTQYAAQRAEREHRAGGDHEEKIASLPDEAAERREELREAHVALLESLGLLSDEDRDILILRHFEKLSFSAIGDVLGCDRETARQMYLQAQERLLKRRGA